MLQMTAFPAEPRTLGGKSELLRLRRQGKVPAIMYGRQVGNVPTALDARTVDQYVRRHGASGIVEVHCGSDRGPALIKEVQRDRITGHVLHLDLQRVSMEDRITATVPVVLAGQSPAV